MYPNRLWCSLLIPLLTAAHSWADPSFTVTYDGVNGSGNHTWTAWVSPDPELFTDTSEGLGSAMAVELAFAIRGSTLVGYEWDMNNWEFENPGMNPFTDTITFETWVSPDDTLVFGAFGSGVFKDAGPFELLYFETLGSAPTSMDYGVAASGDSVKGATLAQRSRLFTGGGSRSRLNSLTASDVALAPLSIPIVEQLLTPSAVVANADELQFVFFTGISGSVSSVPEPGAALLLVSSFLALGIRRHP